MAKERANLQGLNEGPITGNLLTPEERAACASIATKSDDLWGQRARALLAVDEGATQAAAGEQAGLTAGQVQYWVGKFRRGQVNIFPENVLDQAQQGPGKETAKADEKPKKKSKKAKGKKAKKPKEKKAKAVKKSKKAKGAKGRSSKKSKKRKKKGKS